MFHVIFETTILNSYTTILQYMSQNNMYIVHMKSLDSIELKNLAALLKCRREKRKQQ